MRRGWMSFPVAVAIGVVGGCAGPKPADAPAPLTDAGPAPTSPITSVAPGEPTPGAPAGVPKPTEKPIPMPRAEIVPGRPTPTPGTPTPGMPTPSGSGPNPNPVRTGPIPQGAPPLKSGPDAVGNITSDGWKVLADDPLRIAAKVDETVRGMRSVSGTYEYRIDAPNGDVGRQTGEITVRSSRVFRLEHPRFAPGTKSPLVKDEEWSDGTRLARFLDGKRLPNVPLTAKPASNDLVMLPGTLLFSPLGTRHGGIGAWIRARAKAGAIVRTELGPGTNKIIRLNVVEPSGEVVQLVLVRARTFPLSLIRYGAQGGRWLYTVKWDVTPGRTFPRADFRVD